MIKIPIAIALSAITMLYFFVDINISDSNTSKTLPKEFIYYGGVK